MGNNRGQSKRSQDSKRRKERGRREEMRGEGTEEGRKEKTKERKEDRSEESGRRVENLEWERESSKVGSWSKETGTREVS